MKKIIISCLFTLLCCTSVQAKMVEQVLSVGDDLVWTKNVLLVEGVTRFFIADSGTCAEINIGRDNMRICKGESWIVALHSKIVQVSYDGECLHVSYEE